MARDVVDFDDVLAEEREELSQRRQEAGFVPPNAAAGQNYRPEDVNDPIGLAISGGGVRSAAFSLGVMQSLYERGLLRYCDYLSTVSGGSYVGGFLTSLAVHRHSELEWTRRPAATEAISEPAVAPAAPQHAAQRGSAATPAGQNGSTAAVSATPQLAVAQPTAAQPPSAAASTPAQPTASSAGAIRRRTDALAERITIEPDVQRRQPHYVRRLVLGSSYLERPLLFLSHWLPGFLQNNLIAISSLLCVCAIGAWLFRLLDLINSQRLMRVLGFGDDISRAFFPTLVIFGIWTLVLVYRGLRALLIDRGGHSSVAPALTLLLLLMALVSTVSLIGVGDISTAFLTQRFNIQLNPDFVSQLQTIAQWVLYTVLAVAIIPYLSPAALVRSGAENAPWRDRMFFRFMTHAMLWGVPLVLFGMLASENIAQVGQPRDDQYLLSGPSIKDWSTLAAVLGSANPPATESKPTNSPVEDCNYELATRLQKQRCAVDLAALTQLDLDQADTEQLKRIANSAEGISALDLIRQVARESEHRAEIARHTSSLSRMGSAIVWLFGVREDNEFEQQLENEWKYTHDRELAVALLNDQLLSPDLSSAFVPLAARLGPPEGVAKLPPEFHGDATAFLKAHQTAELAESELEVQPPEGTLDYIEKFRRLHLLDAILTHHLAGAPDRARWSSDLYPLRERLRIKLHELRHPVEHLDGRDEIDEAAIESRLRTLEQAHYRLFYEFYGAKLMHPQGTVFGQVVSYADQRFRLTTFGVGLIVFLIAGLCIDLNSTSLHDFYRDRLASVWLVGAHDKVPLLTELKTSETGAPYLLVNCALSFLRARGQDREATAPFLFSHRACGSTRLGFASTTRYEGGRCDLADAMAISGGAVTPTVTRNLAVQALMWLMNWRLGRWMSNPSVRALLDRPASYRRVWQRPQALHLLLSWLLVAEKDRDFHFVSDGGLHENLGIEPLIERRCQLIFAVDAGSDPKEQFEDLVKLLLRLRLNHGVEIETLSENTPLAERTPEALQARTPLGRLLARDGAGKPTADGCCQSHFVLARIRYPNQPQPGWLVYIRPSFDGDESETLRRFRTQNGSFPNDATDDQFYTYMRFEMYRLLGEHIGHSLCTQLVPNLSELESIGQLIERIARHAASTAVVTESTLDPAASQAASQAAVQAAAQAAEEAPDQSSESPAENFAGGDWHFVQSVDGVGPLHEWTAWDAPPPEPAPTEPVAPAEAPVEQPAPLAVKGNGAAKHDGPAGGNGSAAAVPTLEPPAKCAPLLDVLPAAAARFALLEEETQPATAADRLCTRIETIVDELVADPDIHQADLQDRLADCFDRLSRLDPQRAIREMLRVNQRLFRLAGRKPAKSPRERPPRRRAK